MDMSGAAFIYLGRDGKDALGQLQALTRFDEFAEINLRFQVLEPASQSAAALRRELRLNAESAWVLADLRGNCLIQGEKLPNIEEISQALQKAGIKSPIKVLREFLKKRPDHLGARTQLLSHLRRVAEARTVKLLRLDLKTTRELQQQDSYENYYRLNTRRASIDTSDIKGKKLDDKDDLEIWGAYAQEIDNLFSTGDWRLCDLFDRNQQIPADGCSRLMKIVYKRRLPQVYQALCERPSNPTLWRAYGWMRSIARDKPIRLALTAMRPSPTKEADWPPEEVYAFFAEEAIEQNRWENLADLLWEKRHKILYILREPHLFWGSLSNLTIDQRNIVTYNYNMQKRDYIDPLLESLIMTGRVDEAEFIITYLAKLPHFTDIIKHAIDLAVKRDRPDLSTKWSALRVEPKTDFDIDDLKALLYIYSNSNPCVLLINYKEKLSIFEEFPKLGLVSEWKLYYTTLSGDLSELIIKRENWDANETRWALINPDTKVITSQAGLPTSSAITAALEESGIEKTTNALRKFIREYPNHFEAKAELLSLLSDLALEETKQKISEIKTDGTKPGLSASDDLLIWSEYVSLLRQYLQFCVNNSQFIHSNDLFIKILSQIDEIIKYSPMTLALTKEILPDASLNVLRCPTSYEFWYLWTALSDPMSNEQFFNLMSDITPSPLDDSHSVPPNAIKSDLLDRYKSCGNWQGIVNVFGHFMGALTGESGADIYIFFSGMDTMLLLEAYLNLNQEEKIKEMLDVWKPSSNWGYIEIQVKELFKKYGRTF
jgi:hypothetical protein